MTKKWTETVKPWPELTGRKAHRVRVTDVRKIAKTKTFKVTFEFLDAPHTSRQLEIALPLPVRETGLTAEFFRACGLDVLANAQIAPRTTINTILKVHFARERLNNEWKATHFQPAKEDHENGITKNQS